MGFFKTADEIYDQAIDMVGRKDFSGARDKFSKAIEKGTANADHARFCIAMINMASNFGSASNYNALKEATDKLPPGGVTFGVTTVDRDLIIRQCECAVHEINAQNMSDDDYMAKGQALIQVAMEIATAFGETVFPIQDMIKGTSITGTRESITLQAIAYEIMGKGAVYANPKQGSEYLQMAYNFRRQLGDSGEEDLKLIKNFSITAKCWMCGRQVAGQGVHFMAVRSEISDMFREKEASEAIRSEDEDFNTLYMCMPCYTAISNRSEEITLEYYNDCIRQMREMEARLQAEIASLRLSMSFSRR